MIAMRNITNLGLTLRLAGAALCVLSSPSSLAVDFGAIGGAVDNVQRAQSAANNGQQLLETGRSATDGARSLWQRSQQASELPSSSISTLRVPEGRAPLIDEQGGPRRLLAVLDDAWHRSARRGKAIIALMDQGPYLVQRRAAHVAPLSAQWLATPRGDSTGVFIDLPAEPEGTTYDFATGRVRPGGRGVRIYALSVHADVPVRAGRRSLDAIEQHAMLRATSMRTSWPTQAGEILDVIGGKLLVWSSDAAQRFPSGFGLDGKLFTPDDPMVTLPRGYTVVTLDPQGFRFDRGREIALPFHPVMPVDEVDYSRLPAGDAVAALVALITEQHPRTARQKLDFDSFRGEYLSRYRAAAERKDIEGQAQLLSELGLRLRDGLYRVQLPDGRLWPSRVDRGLGPQMVNRGSVNLPMPRVWLRDDGRWVVTGVAPGSPAAQVGLQPGTEIRSIDGDSPNRYLDRIDGFSSRATAEGRKQDALPLELFTASTLALRVQPNGGPEQELRLGGLPAAAPSAPTEPALGSFLLRSFKGGNFAYVAIDSFSDGDTGQLSRWESSLAAAKQARVQGLIIDLRAHQGLSHQLVPHMLASLFAQDRPLHLVGSTQRIFDPTTRLWRSRGALGLPALLPLVNSGTNFTEPVVVLTGHGCAGPCELFAAWLQQSRRADIISPHATGGALGQTTRVLLPGGLSVHVPLFEETGPTGQDTAAPLQSRGTTPRVRVPVDVDFIAAVQAGGDPVLDAAIRQLEQSQTNAMRR